MRRWWHCARDGHQPTVYIGWLMPHQAIVRCDCGRGISPRLVYIQTDGVTIRREPSQEQPSDGTAPATTTNAQASRSVARRLSIQEADDA